MIIKQEWTVTCRGCQQPFQLREYEGLEGGRYGDHHCPELSEYWLKHPRATRCYDPKV